MATPTIIIRGGASAMAVRINKLIMSPKKRLFELFARPSLD